MKVCIVQLEGWVHHRYCDDDADDDCNGDDDDDGNEENQNLRFVGSKTWTGTCDKKGTECTQSDTSR